jgi:AbiU2
MSDHQSSEDVRAGYAAAMGEELGAIHHALWHQVAILHIRWNNYRGLFASSPHTIELLNAAAPAFFFETERMMWEDILLHLCRLTDRPQVGPQKKDTLTLKRVPPLIVDLPTRATSSDWLMRPTKEPGLPATGATDAWHTPNYHRSSARSSNRLPLPVVKMSRTHWPRSVML